MTQRNAAEFKSVGDSKSLTKIDGKPITIVAVEDSSYDDQPGVKITTKESYDVDGTPYNKWHTTRGVLTAFFSKEVREALIKGDSILTKTKLMPNKTPGKKDYWVFE